MGGNAGVLAGLRRWAAGSYPDEAAVELLAALFRGRFATRAYPWVVVEDNGWVRLEPEALLTETGELSGGERRALAVVGSLAGGGPVDLADVVCGVDAATLPRLLTAIAAAAGYPGLLARLDDPDLDDPRQVDDAGDLAELDGPGGPDDNPDDDPGGPDLSALFRAVADPDRPGDERGLW
jgi:hypothetical protein